MQSHNPFALNHFRMLHKNTWDGGVSATFFPTRLTHFPAPLFSYSYKFLFPQPFSFDTHTKTTGCGSSFGLSNPKSKLLLELPGFAALILPRYFISLDIYFPGVKIAGELL
jgi:hypothetical protein